MTLDTMSDMVRAVKRRGSPLWLAVAGLLVASSTVLARNESSDVCSIETSERIVAVADVHGAYDRFVTILRAADLIDAGASWIGGRTVLVQTGARSRTTQDPDR